MLESAWQKLRPLMELTTPWALRVVATLRVPDLIASGVCELEALADRCSADAETLGRVLRYLVTQGVFEEPAPGRFRLTPTGHLLEDEAGVRAWLDQEGFGARMDRAWPALLDTVRTGKPCYADVFGRPFWEDLDAHPPIAESLRARGDRRALSRAGREHVRPPAAGGGRVHPGDGDRRLGRPGGRGDPAPLRRCRGRAGPSPDRRGREKPVGAPSA